MYFLIAGLLSKMEVEIDFDNMIHNDYFCYQSEYLVYQKLRTIVVSLISSIVVGVFVDLFDLFISFALFNDFIRFG